jgi:hypothetical protein
MNVAQTILSAPYVSLIEARRGKEIWYGLIVTQDPDH